MLSYYEPEATAAAFAGGWFHSGDAAVVHPDGYVEILDRYKDVIISGGENISSIEVEGALLRHPCLDSCDRVVLDMDSSETLVHGEQQGSAYNGHCSS
jgi:acyl-CoA synthetase (AMP-forming)/AMP-acid ligase II